MAIAFAHELQHVRDCVDLQHDFQLHAAPGGFGLDQRADRVRRSGRDQIEAFERAESDRTAAGAPRGAQEAGGFGQDRLDPKQRRRYDIVHHRDIDAPGEEPLLQGHAQGLYDGEFGVAIAFPHCAYDRHRQHLPDRRRQADGDPTGEIGIAAGDGMPRAFELMRNSLGMHEEAPAAIGQRGATPVAVEQIEFERTLQGSHLPADGRLRHAEHGGGTAKASELRYSHEIFELTQIHRAPFGYASLA